MYITKSEYIYNNLKNEIIEGTLNFGERIIISDISAKYNVSPMPVREAITKLEQYGYVEIIPHVGAKVVVMDTKKIKEIMLLRNELEPLGAKLAVPFIDDDLILDLELLIKKMDSAMENNNGNLYAKLNKEFHDKIYEKNPYPEIKKMIKELLNRSEVTTNIVSSRMVDSSKEHKIWLQAIKEKDPEKVEEIVKKHKTNAFKEFGDLYGVDKKMKNEYS